MVHCVLYGRKGEDKGLSKFLQPTAFWSHFQLVGERLTGFIYKGYELVSFRATKAKCFFAHATTAFIKFRSCGGQEG